DQFRNTDMIDGYRGIGRGDHRAVTRRRRRGVPLRGDCRMFLGCHAGVARDPLLHRVAVEPAESAVLACRAAGTHRIACGGAGLGPDLLERTEFDEVIAISTADAFAMARRAARVEGLLSGPSTGANLAAALLLAERLGPARTVVTIQVDSGLKYLAGNLYD